MIHRLKLRRLPTDYLIAMMRTVRHVRVRLLNRHTMEPVVDSSTVDEVREVEVKGDLLLVGFWVFFGGDRV